MSVVGTTRTFRHVRAMSATEGKADVQRTAPMGVTATLVLDGVPCSYRARKTHAYEGTMSCAGRAPVPLLCGLISPYHGSTRRSVPGAASLLPHANEVIECECRMSAPGRFCCKSRSDVCWSVSLIES